MQTSPPAGTVRSWLDDRAQNQPDKISHLFPGGEPLTWHQLRDHARNVATGLTRKGIAKGESVAIMMPNSRASIITLFGVLYGGFRALQVNLVAGPDAMGYALSHSRARFVLLGPAQQSLFDSASKAQANSITPIETQTGTDWIETDGDASLHQIGPGDDALLMYTSGTTGRPKGVLHTHASLLAGGWTPALAHQLKPEDRALCVLPIYHINGLCVTIMAPLISSSSVVVCEKFSASRFWQLCAQFEVTWFSVVPTIISHLLHGEENPAPETITRIRFGRSASSALAPEVQSAFEQRFGIAIVETMGLTETAAQILSNPLPPGVRKIGSPGLAYGNEVEIFDTELQPVPSGTEGEIVVRGPNVMAGYLDNREATGQALTNDGWLRTGDLGRKDGDGYIFVTGRLKELIIKGGENIAPREVDEALYSHPDVVEAAAFARDCPQYGQRVEAGVKLRDGSQVRAEDLVRICQEKLGEFKAPDHVHILPELPKGPSGKIQRMKLAELNH